MDGRDPMIFHYITSKQLSLLTEREKIDMQRYSLTYPRL